MSTNMSSLFESAEQMQEALTCAVREARIARPLSEEQLDKMCGFGNNTLGPSVPMPSTKAFEENPRMMTSRVFSAASFALDLNIDDVLEISMDDHVLPTLVEAMKQDTGGVVALTGGQSAEEISPETQAPVYAMLKALEEMDLIAESYDGS